MRCALKAYIDGKNGVRDFLSLEDAVAASGVSRATFLRRLHELGEKTVTIDDIGIGRKGRKPALPASHELKLIDILCIRGRLRSPMTKPQLSQLIAAYATIASNDDDEISVPESWGKNWRTSRPYVRDFIERHKDKIRVARAHFLTQHRQTV